MGNDEGMEKEGSRFQAILRLAGIIALAALGLLVMVVAVCWFAGWRMASQISSGLTWVGAAAIVFGVLSVFGGWGVARDPQYMYAQSVSHQDMSDRTRQGLGDSLRSYNFAIVATTAGLLCLAIGALIGTFFA
jgi:hypothetical protein